MATRVQKIIVKENPLVSAGVIFSVYVEDPGVGEPVIVNSLANAEAPEDFDENLRDAIGVTWAVTDLP